MRKQHPFQIDAWVVLPEHLHCIWHYRLMTALYYVGDYLKADSRALPKKERRSAVRKAAGERGLWQRHFWEHIIGDDLDYQRHIDYVHVNPLKPGYVKRVVDWPYSTFHRYVAQGIYYPNWCGDINISVGSDE